MCKHCGHHFDITAPQRIEMLTDEGSFTQMDAEIEPCDPLGFVAAKPYETSLEGARQKSGLNEAIITGRATIGEVPVVFGAMDFRFIGASMGSVVGEKVARAFELATVERLPIVLVDGFGWCAHARRHALADADGQDAAPRRSGMRRPDWPTSPC